METFLFEFDYEAPDIYPARLKIKERGTNQVLLQAATLAEATEVANRLADQFISYLWHGIEQQPQLTEQDLRVLAPPAEPEKEIKAVSVSDKEEQVQVVWTWLYDAGATGGNDELYHTDTEEEVLLLNGQTLKSLYWIFDCVGWIDLEDSPLTYRFFLEFGWASFLSEYHPCQRKDEVEDCETGGLVQTPLKNRRFKKAHIKRWQDEPRIQLIFVFESDERITLEQTVDKNEGEFNSIFYQAAGSDDREILVAPRAESCGEES